MNEEMSDDLKKCPACNGRGYFRCDCWPADCICGCDEEDCDECGGEGWIDPSYDELFEIPAFSYGDEATEIIEEVGTITPSASSERASNKE